jgi:predicted RNase H-like HicB family nuclease
MSSTSRTKSSNSNSDSREFTIYYQKEEEGGYSGYCAELPGAISQGESLQELEDNMKDAIELILESIKAEEDATNKKKIVIRVPA